MNEDGDLLFTNTNGLCFPSSIFNMLENEYKLYNLTEICILCRIDLFYFKIY